LEQLAVACPCGTCQQQAVTQRLPSLVGSLPELLLVSIALLCGRATCASLPARWALGTPRSGRQLVLKLIMLMQAGLYYAVCRVVICFNLCAKHFAVVL